MRHLMDFSYLCRMKYLRFNSALLALMFVVLLTACGQMKAESEHVVESSTEHTANASGLAFCDTLLMKEELRVITKGEYRQYTNTARLDTVAAYIYRHFRRYADTTYYQRFEVEGKRYQNVICIFGLKNSERTVIGAHYDACGEQEGADDNASGVVGLLELARLLKGQALDQQIELVAYTLEEPPFFRTEWMGSYQHAAKLSKDRVKVRGMICLEMIAYFSDKKDSQEYPVEGMSSLYGSTGDYIALVSALDHGKFVKSFSSAFKQTEKVKTKEISAPASMQGIDFSDHLNYWHFGFEALMITDTAFFRNKNYHEKGDQMETLDLARMALVIEAVFEAIRAKA